MLNNPSWTEQYSKSARGISMAAFVLTIGVLILLNPPWNVRMAVGLLGVVAGFFLYLLIIRHSNEIKAQAKEKIIYNLTIDIQCHKRNFEKTLLHSAEDEIEMYGLAIYRAKKYLKGNWKVTEKGYLVRGFAQDLENRTAEIDIDDVTPGLAVLQKVLTGQGQMKDNSCRVHLHFKESGGVMNVGVDANGLYLD